MAKAEPPRTFLVECYEPDIARRDVEAFGRQATAISARLRAGGHEIEYLRAMLVPGDDAVFHVFSAGSIETVREAAELAGIPFERIVESVAVEVARQPVPRVTTPAAEEVPNP